MTLAGRVSLFFLGALGLALAGYSAASYYFAQTYLNEQFDAGLRGALDILAASVEVEQDDAKWQPQEHGIDLRHPLLAQARWIVSDENGQTIDCSPALSRRDPQDAALFEYSRRFHEGRKRAMKVSDWRVLQRQMNAPQPKPIAERDPHDFASIRITVARSPQALNSELRKLATVVIALPAAVCLIAAIIGGAFVKRALRPVRAMASSARSMGRADFGRRLPIGPSRDELADLGEEFNRLLDRLQQAYERQRRFTGDAAHQLRTPLTVLQGQIDVLRRRERSVEEYVKTLGVLSEQTGELSRIVESLLFMARLEQDSAPPPQEPLQLNDWLAVYAERWKSHSRAGDFSLELGDNASIQTSSPLLGQLLDNLIHNAFKYSQPATPVTLQTIRRDDQITLAVEDHGVGIPKEDLPSIFEPFFRSAEARRAGIAGAGLGLAIATRIATALNGKLECESEHGAGTTFFLHLPLTQPPG